MLWDYLTIIYKNLKSRKLRSFLTIIGIVIGVMAIFTLITVSSAFKASIVNQINKLGTTKLYIVPKGFGERTTSYLDKKDILVVKSMPEVDFTIAYLSSFFPVEYKKEKRYLLVYGVETENFQKALKSYDLKIIKGGMINKNSNEVLLGYLAKDFFSEELNPGMRIKINGLNFKVKGILSQVGNQEDDSMIYMPIDILREMTGKHNEISMFEVNLKKNVNINKTAKKIYEKIKQVRGQEDFQVLTPDALLKQMNVVLDIITIVLVGIALIAIVVGAIGIMNSMYTAVLERTKEIGIMKAIGAKRNEILTIFLLESGIIGLIGGFIGVFLGYIISLFIEYISVKTNVFIMDVRFSFTLFVLTLFFSFILGLLSGLMPTKKALNITVVEALSYKK